MVDPFVVIMFALALALAWIALNAIAGLIHGIYRGVRDVRQYRQ